MRSTIDAMGCRNTPLPDGHDGEGRLIADLARRGCRFPIREAGGRTFFCAETIAEADFRPGFSLGSYCRFHSDYLRGRTRAEKEARAAA